MGEHPKGTVVCQICEKTLQHHDAYPGHFVREAVVETIRKHHPDWSPDGYICRGILPTLEGNLLCAEAAQDHEG